MSDNEFLQQPRLRDGVHLQMNADAAEIRYREFSYEIDFEADTRADSEGFLDALRVGGRTPQNLRETFPALGDDITYVLREFDRLGLLTETATPETTAMSGPQFFRELLRYTDRIKRSKATSSLYQGLLDGTVSRQQIIGYAVEYYHVVRMCPGLLAPSLAIHEGERTREALMRFFVSELRHDEMLARSLASVGISKADLDLTMPLPMTFALLSSLGVYARQHPLTFKASLFLFEQPDDDFNAALEARCRDLDMPEAFFKPIFQHAVINENASHDDVSADLFDEVEFVSEEEQTVVKRHVGLMVESMIIMEAQMLEYYGNPENPQLRLYK